MISGKSDEFRALKFKQILISLCSSMTKVLKNFVMAGEFCKVFNKMLRRRGLDNQS